MRSALAGQGDAPRRPYKGGTTPAECRACAWLLRENIWTGNIWEHWEHLWNIWMEHLDTHEFLGVADLSCVSRNSPALCFSQRRTNAGLATS